MLHFAYLVLSAAALWLNRTDWRALTVAILVTVSVFIPVPRDSAEVFYGFCISFELLVLCTAIALGVRAGPPIAAICAILIFSHVFGYMLNGSLPLSPYRITVKLLETGELLTCIFLAAPVADRLRNRRQR